MKNRKRAERRRTQELKLKRRAKNYYEHSFALSVNKNKKSWADYWKEIKAGQYEVWMRHTGKPCSCEMCSPKYERPSSNERRKIIKEQLDEYYEEIAV